MSADRSGIHLRVAPEPWNDHFALYVFRNTLFANGWRTEAIAEIEWEEVPAGSMGPATPLRVPLAQLQIVMDELWRNGIRPTEVGTAGHLSALVDERDHLRGLVDRILPSALRK